MAYKKKFFNDKTIIILSSISVVAISALIGGALLDTGNMPDDNKNIVDLNESETSGNTPVEQVQVQPEEEPEQETEEGTEEETTTGKQEIVKNDEEVTSEALTEESVVTDTPASSLIFASDSVLSWPVDGNIIMDYDMENTIYFPTLNLYKCSDSIAIQSASGTPVYAACDCVIKDINYNEEIGNYVVTDLGNQFELTYGQLKDIVINKNDVINSGDLIGYVASPTEYYTLEGDNLYLKLTENGSPVNPLDYLNYE